MGCGCKKQKQQQVSQTQKPKQVQNTSNNLTQQTIKETIEKYYKKNRG